MSKIPHQAHKPTSLYSLKRNEKGTRMLKKTVPSLQQNMEVDKQLLGIRKRVLPEAMSQHCGLLMEGRAYTSGVGGSSVLGAGGGGEGWENPLNKEFGGVESPNTP